MVYSFLLYFWHLGTIFSIISKFSHTSFRQSHCNNRIFHKIIQFQTTRRYCSLQLTQKYHQFYPTSRSVPILSKKSAVGLVMGTGSIGTNINSTVNVYLSRDGGFTWREVGGALRHQSLIQQMFS